MIKKKVLILGGGKSTEHEVSLVSAYNIFQNIPSENYTALLVAVDKKGIWRHCEDLIFDVGDISKVRINPEAPKIFIEDFIRSQKIDLVFPILHGTGGEDGCLQGFLETLNLAYVGSDVRSSAVCMDKVFTKIILEKAGVKTVPYRDFLHNQPLPKFSELCKELGSKNLIVKASALGSSVGVYLCEDETSFKEACQKIQRIDAKILVEKQIQGRELEIAVLGNHNPEVSLVGEIVLKNYDFYSYEAKYLDEKGVELVAPIELPDELLAKMQKISKTAYKVLHCSGLARIDFFLAGEEVYLNEINSLPGFTKISMYPRLWQVSGLSYSALIDKLLKLALERKLEQEKKQQPNF